MKFSEAWLREWVDPPISTAELTEQLTMAGLEVDAVSPVAGEFDSVVVGEVLAVEPHPDAERLRVCQVGVGTDEPLNIVCGAPNVYAGMHAPTALVGARLPNGMKVKPAKLRGVPSAGMLCSGAELGLEEQSGGLLDLGRGPTAGASVRDALGLDDRAIELDLTPNRGDCLGMEGVAREVGVLNRCAVNAPEMPVVEPAIEDVFDVVVEAAVDCPRYVGRVIRGVDPKAVTPLWMRERLRRGGLRSLGPLVDVTNYVLLELGQPMHAFDLSQLRSGIVVRLAAEGEKLTLLDGQEIELKAGTLVIADRERPLALAGIMGGEGSGVSDETCDIFLESAYFTPTTLAGRARAYGLHTDSSHRFERGVDPELQRRATERATRLLLDIAGGRAGPVIEVVAEANLPARPEILLRRERVGRVLGVEIADAEIVEMLTRLGMRLDEDADGWRVTAPGYRFDIAIEADLIEEIGRVYGYASVPASQAHSAMFIHPSEETAHDPERVQQRLVDLGYQEAITYSFIAPALQQAIDPDQTPIKLANPISQDMSVMRTSLWPGLLTTAQHNQRRQQERVRIFEYGLRFIKQPNEIKQESIIAGLASGAFVGEQWAVEARSVDFFDVKADVWAILDLTGRGGEFGFVPGEHPALHPGQTARIERAGKAVGWLGMLHPRLERELDLAGHTYLFEIRTDSLDDGALPAFQPLSRFPSIRRDLAIVVAESVSFSAVRDCVQGAIPEILQDIRLFDVYTGNKIDSGAKSLALGLILQDSSRTLEEAEVEAGITVAMRALGEQLGARLRD